MDTLRRRNPKCYVCKQRKLVWKRVGSRPICMSCNLTYHVYESGQIVPRWMEDARPEDQSAI